MGRRQRQDVDRGRYGLDDAGDVVEVRYAVQVVVRPRGENQPARRSCLRGGFDAFHGDRYRVDDLGVRFVVRADGAKALVVELDSGGGVLDRASGRACGGECGIRADPTSHGLGGSYLHTGPTSLFELLGFQQDRKIAKWRWVMRLRVEP